MVSRRGAAPRPEGARVTREFVLRPVERPTDECVWRAEDGTLGTGFQEVSVRHSDFALAAAAVQLALDRDGVCRRLALSVGGTGATAVRVAAATERLIGTRLADQDIDAAAAIVSRSIEGITDPHASVAYRRRIAGAVAARALAEARTEATARTH